MANFLTAACKSAAKWWFELYQCCQLCPHQLLHDGAQKNTMGAFPLPLSHVYREECAISPSALNGLRWTVAIHRCNLSSEATSLALCRASVAAVSVKSENLNTNRNPLITTLFLWKLMFSTCAGDMVICAISYQCCSISVYCRFLMLQ